MERVVLMPYDVRWPQIFVEESQRLRGVLTPYGLASVEHVGSTAIQGMSAKPIVDIMAGVKTMKGLPEPEHSLWTSLGYEWGHGSERPAEWWYFIKRDCIRERVAHLHLAPLNSEFRQRMIAFRDALREDEHLAQQYNELKARLAAQYGHDRLRYLAEKEPFVNEVVDRRLAQR